MAMELIDGLPLDEYATRKKLTIKKIVELFVVVCRAVGYAQFTASRPPGSQTCQYPCYCRRHAEVAGFSGSFATFATAQARSTRSKMLR